MWCGNEGVVWCRNEGVVWCRNEAVVWCGNEVEMEGRAGIALQGKGRDVSGVGRGRLL